MSFRFPPLTFGAYGLGGSWSGKGWVDELRWSCGPEGPAAEGYDQIEAIWLGHGESLMPSPESKWALVGSFNLNPLAGDVEELALTDGLFKLTGSLRPPLDEEQEFTYSRRVYEFAQEAVQSKMWRNVQWTCDRRSLQAEVLEWAGGWLGHASAFHDLPVLVIAANHDAEGFDLSLVSDGIRYDFDPRGPIDWPNIVEDSQRAAFGPTPNYEARWRHHKDHDRLLQPPLPLPPPPKPYVPTSPGVRLLELVAFEDRISRGWRATTDDARRLEIRISSRPAAGQAPPRPRGGRVLSERN